MTLDNALRDTNANAIRLSALGDPARARRPELHRAVREAAARGLSVLGYTHFWREPGNQDLRGILMASCPDAHGVDDTAAMTREMWLSKSLRDAQKAIDMGWMAAVVVAHDQLDHGNLFDIPGGYKGLVCPAQKDELRRRRELDAFNAIRPHGTPEKGLEELPHKVTCSSCRLCALNHTAWMTMTRKRIRAIGFLEHSRSANKHRGQDHRAAGERCGRQRGRRGTGTGRGRRLMARKKAYKKKKKAPALPLKVYLVSIFGVAWWAAAKTKRGACTQLNKRFAAEARLGRKLGPGDLFEVPTKEAGAGEVDDCTTDS